MLKELVLNLVLAPVLLIQGLYVRNTIVRLPEPSGDRSGSTETGTPLSVLIIGDSAAAGVGVEHQSDALSGVLVNALSSGFQVDWRLIAKSGETTASCCDALTQYTDESYDVVVVSLGVNDVTSMKSSTYFIDQTRRLVALLKDRFNPDTIIFSGLPPMGAFPGLPHPLRWFLGRRARQFDQKLQLEAIAMGCLYYAPELPHDPAFMATDGFHPGAPVYQHWGSAVSNLIKHRLGKS